jgi:hypothetical protein
LTAAPPTKPAIVAVPASPYIFIALEKPYSSEAQNKAAFAASSPEARHHCGTRKALLLGDKEQTRLCRDTSLKARHIKSVSTID